MLFNADWLPEEASRSGPACSGCWSTAAPKPRNAAEPWSALAYAVLIARPAVE